MRDDTIVAISTPPGNGAIGVIRLSGPDSRGLLAKVWRGVPVDSFEPNRTYLGKINDLDGRSLDEAVCLYWQAPHSYTGEDVVEIQAHGGYRLLEAILENLVRAGARLALPGEFTRRAFLNGRLDLAQAEGVADLINAGSREAARLAERQLSGELSRMVGQLRNNLVVMRAQLEARIDFPEDEDVQGLRYNEIGERVGSVEQEIEKLLVTYREGRAYREGIRVAIVGKPNVGKSSLLNALLNEERAIVHPTPGTTRDTIEELLDLNGLPVRFMDTAGIREGREPIETEGIRRTRERIGSADLVLVVFDVSRSWDREDDQVREAASGREVLFVWNKMDLPAASPVLKPPLFVKERGMGGEVEVSAKTGDGIEPLKQAIRARFVSNRPTDGVVLTNLRHKLALEQGLAALRQVAESARQKMSLEFLASDLLIASNHLGEITGEITTDEILSEIFSKFCLGK